ncbi:hypothetical protein TNIN_218061 [Trichonephila inaurata madagascariensis]|uniref:Uncharacterized protein n=1 Tax=Trichonephila inaurata madagascariensis TaxID=2747483 RepID=A0A8X6X584_9ARAC|nr:hypothetical protein TNIN_218061 [Trichonephila inaurata madagascariensis]
MSTSNLFYLSNSINLDYLFITTKPHLHSFQLHHKLFSQHPNLIFKNTFLIPNDPTVYYTTLPLQYLQTTGPSTLTRGVKQPLFADDKEINANAPFRPSAIVRQAGRKSR